MIDCKVNVERRLQHLADFVKKNHMTDRKLAVIQIGDNPASNSYIKGKKKDAELIGIEVMHLKYAEDVDTETVCNLIDLLNTTWTVEGIIVQMPIPEHLDKQRIINTIADEKDVDGFKTTSGFYPCTPLGIMSILEDINYNVKGKTVCVLGQGTVGKPLIDILIDKRATVISCGSQTSVLERNCHMKNCDVLITAVGKKDLINVNDFWNMAEQRYSFPEVIIDVGINRDENGKLCGDVNKELYEYVDKITPVPGGVGLYTRVSLMENTIYKDNKEYYI